MRWGRTRKTALTNEKQQAGRPSVCPGWGARSVLIAGALLCALFFSSAAAGERLFPDCPDALSQGAVYALHRDHRSLAALLGLDAHPGGSVSAGAFDNRADDAYRDFVHPEDSFGEYLRRAWRLLLGNEEDA